MSRLHKQSFGRCSFDVKTERLFVIEKEEASARVCACVSAALRCVRSSKACPLVTGPACWVTDSPGREGTPGCLADN